MLERLEVSGFGIIERVEMDLDRGFAALTGETGAGKSLLVESLNLLSGGRAQTDLVRTGDDRLMVEGTFTADGVDGLAALASDLGVPVDHELVVRREVTAAGRSRGWLNDVTVTAASLQRVAPLLLAVHGQHEQHGLADPNVQRAVVDRFAEHDELRERVARAHGCWLEAAAEVSRLRQASGRRRDRLDAIAFQLSEIESAALEPGEDEALRRRRQMLRNAARLYEASTGLLARLTDDDLPAVDALVAAERNLEVMADCGLLIDGARERLAEARIHVEEVALEVRNAGAEIAEDPAALEEVESRLHRVEQLTLKYGSPIQAVLDHRDSLVAEREELEGVEDRLGEAERVAAEALDRFDETARELDGSRRAAGRELARAVAEVLEELNMTGTVLEFRWRAKPDSRSPLVRDGEGCAFDEGGVEQCELLIAANPGEEPRAMARIASGGELSRIHLALRTVLLGRRTGSGLTLLFDEVDSGLGGTTASALAGLLAALADEHQVLVVTHLPQVAARAAHHFRVEKVIREGRAVTTIEELDPSQRQDELARMLSGGEVTETARKHARTLLEGR
jgi:DNA repair protein RecN (Recombination protein N)